MATDALELWGGIECTINRVGDRFRDQLALNRHYDRPTDLDLFARLGIRTIRYPLLWEHVAAEGEKAWSQAEGYLTRLRAKSDADRRAGASRLGPALHELVGGRLRPWLGGLCGRSGPRFPWLDHFTPVNEPLTTARFSALYGHWYPHGAATAHLCALVNQCRAAVLAMQTIRRITPHAQWIQTENLEQVHSTTELNYQAHFENLRRWLSVDLLLGRVTCEHELWNYLTENGVSPTELEWFIMNASPPAILGWNYYLTSERFLDSRIERYPATFMAATDMGSMPISRRCTFGARESPDWQRF